MLRVFSPHLPLSLPIIYSLSLFRSFSLVSRYSLPLPLRASLYICPLTSFLRPCLYICIYGVYVCRVFRIWCFSRYFSNVIISAFSTRCFSFVFSFAVSLSHSLQLAFSLSLISIYHMTVFFSHCIQFISH